MSCVVDQDIDPLVIDLQRVDQGLGLGPD